MFIDLHIVRFLRTQNLLISGHTGYVCKTKYVQYDFNWLCHKLYNHKCSNSLLHWNTELLENTEPLEIEDTVIANWFDKFVLRSSILLILQSTSDVVEFSSISFSSMKSSISSAIVDSSTLIYQFFVYPYYLLLQFDLIPHLYLQRY